jgi:uncharacterized protein YbjT (DUF2867 family)
MKFVIIGGSGLIGSKLVAKLRERGHEAFAASPSSGVDTVTGKGLADALSGADVVVDVANSPSFEDEPVLAFFETSGSNLIAAEIAAGVKHHVALSVVGTERLLESGYFRAKMAQETLIKASPIPHSIVRATQFFEFLGAIAYGGTDGDVVRLSSALMQPIAAQDVADALVPVALGAPINGTIDVAGPDKRPLSDFVGEYLRANGDFRAVIASADTSYFGVRLDDGSLNPQGEARTMPTRFADWLAASSVVTA